MLGRGVRCAASRHRTRVRQFGKQPGVPRRKPEPRSQSRPPDSKMAPSAAASCQDGGARPRPRSRPLLPQPSSAGERDSRRCAPVALRPGCTCRCPPRTMRLLGWWQVLLWVLGSPARAEEREYRLGQCAAAREAVREMTGKVVYLGDALLSARRPGSARLASSWRPLERLSLRCPDLFPPVVRLAVRGGRRWGGMPRPCISAY